MNGIADILRGIHFLESIVAMIFVLIITVDSFRLAYYTPKPERQIHGLFGLAGVAGIALFTGTVTQTWHNFGQAITIRTLSFLIGFTLSLYVLSKLARRSVRIEGVKQFIK